MFLYHGEVVWLPWKPVMFIRELYAYNHPTDSVEFDTLHKNNTAILYHGTSLSGGGYGS